MFTGGLSQFMSCPPNHSRSPPAPQPRFRVSPVLRSRFSAISQRSSTLYKIFMLMWFIVFARLVNVYELLPIHIFLIITDLAILVFFTLLFLLVLMWTLIWMLWFVETQMESPKDTQHTFAMLKSTRPSTFEDFSNKIIWIYNLVKNVFMKHTLKSYIKHIF